jgi:hypothetical protein
VKTICERRKDLNIKLREKLVVLMTHMGIPPLSGPNKNAEASKRPSHGEYRENMKQEAVRLNAE